MRFAGNENALKPIVAQILAKLLILQEYHSSKSVIMTSHENQRRVTLNNVPVPIVTEYKYLGDIIVPDNSLEKLINARKNIVNGTTAEIASISAETR